MKNVNTVLKDIFSSTSGKTIPELYSRMENLPLIGSSTPVVLKEAYLAKFLTVSADTNSLALDTLDSVHSYLGVLEGNFLSISDTQGRTGDLADMLYRVSGSPAISFPVAQSGTGPYVNALTHIGKSPVNLCVWQVDEIEDLVYIGITNRSESWLVSNYENVEWSDDNPYASDKNEHWLIVLSCSYRGDSLTNPSLIYANSLEGSYAMRFEDEDGDAVSLSFEDVLDEASSRVSSTDTLLEILKRAQIDGVISVSQIKDIINYAGDSETTAAITQIITGMDKLSYTSVVSLISRVLGLAAFNINSAQTYTPLDSPTYISSITSLALSFIATAVTTVIAIISRTWGIILSLVGYLASVIWAQWNDLKEKTQASVSRYSELPVFNLPIGLAERSSGVDPDVRAMVDDYGCAALFLYGDGTPFVWWVLPKNLANMEAPEYYVQAFLYALGPDTVTYRTYRAEATAGGYWKMYAMSNMPATPSTWSADTAALLTASDADLLNIARRNIMISLGHLSIYKADSDASWDIPWPMAIKNVVKSTEFNSLSYSQAMSALYSLMANIDKGLISYSVTWEDLYAIVSCDMFQRAMNHYLASLSTVGMMSAAGAEVANPSVQWPNISASALYGAVTLSAVLTAAAVASAVIVKRKIRTSAVGRISARQVAYDQALSQYEADPSKANLNRLYRANRRLTRAWNRAGRAGVSAYNGFSTSTTPVVAKGATSGVSTSFSDLSTIFSGFEQAMRENDLSAVNVIRKISGSANADVNSADILEAIIGPSTR